jgi:chromosomal replication initiation ATPase DnaA
MNTFAIVSEMSHERGLDPWDVRSSKRHAEFVRARVAISRRLHAEGCTLHEIARALGGKDHTSVMYYLGKLNRPNAKRPMAHQAVNP